MCYVVKYKTQEDTCYRTVREFGSPISVETYLAEYLAWHKVPTTKTLPLWLLVYHPEQTAFDCLQLSSDKREFRLLILHLEPISV